MFPTLCDQDNNPILNTFTELRGTRHSDWGGTACPRGVPEAEE